MRELEDKNGFAKETVNGKCLYYVVMEMIKWQVHPSFQEKGVDACSLKRKGQKKNKEQAIRAANSGQLCKCKKLKQMLITGC